MQQAFEQREERGEQKRGERPCLGVVKVVAARADTAQDAPQLAMGRVIQLRGRRFGLELEGAAGAEAVEARRADGCLLLPEVGDRVLALCAPDGGHFILNVLEKAGKGATLQFEGDVKLTAPEGVCEVQAREVGLSGLSGSLRFGRLDVLSRRLEARVEQVMTAVSSTTLAAASFTARIGQALRFTGFELHRAKSLRSEVEGRFSVSSGQTTLLAKDDVTVDAGKINLG